MTHKQADILILMIERKRACTEDISHFLREIYEDDIACGEAPLYLSTSYESCYACLINMERRGWVTRPRRGEWMITEKGDHAANAAGI
jgi:hypothetical protein